MKKSVYLFILIFSMLFGGISANAKGSPENDGKMLTQYVLVEVVYYGAHLRDYSEMARILKSYGFSVSSVKSSRNRTYFTASRKGTNIQVVNEGGNRTCTINFQTQYEVNTFVESLIKSHWVYSGGEYNHPENNYAANGLRLFARVRGKTVVISNPF